VAGSLLSSFKALAFYPDCTEALLVAGRLRPGAFGPAEAAIAAEVEAEVGGVGVGGVGRGHTAVRSDSVRVLRAREAHKLLAG
jgi:hypothetical protein